MGAHNFGQDKVQIPLRTADWNEKINYTSQAKDVFVKKKKKKKKQAKCNSNIIGSLHHKKNSG